MILDFVSNLPLAVGDDATSVQVHRRMRLRISMVIYEASVFIVMQGLW